MGKDYHCNTPERKKEEMRGKRNRAKLKNVPRDLRINRIPIVPRSVLKQHEKLSAF
jgi:hypothetical protein